MRKSTFLCLVLFISVTGFCQRNVDSLKKLILHASHDTTAARRYALIAVYSYPNVDSTELYARKGLLLSQQLGWHRGIAEAKYALVDWSNHSRSLSHLLDCLKIFEEIKDTVALM